MYIVCLCELCYYRSNGRLVSSSDQIFCACPVDSSKNRPQGTHEKFGVWGRDMIASCDYCHAPLGVSSFSFSILNVWEMTTVVDKIACSSCTACPPPIVLRLFIVDTISIKALRTRQKYSKFYWHDGGTSAKPTKKPICTASSSTASEDDVPKASLHVSCPAHMHFLARIGLVTNEIARSVIVM